jgi:hypothetical protein
MERIVRVHHPDLDRKLLREVLKKFYWLREIEEFRKKPSTSELIDWVQALKAGGVSIHQIERELPFAGVLIKKEQDLSVFQEIEGGRRQVLPRRSRYL